MSEHYKKLLSKKILTTTKQFALNNLNNLREYKEDSDMFFTRIYVESYMDALVADDYTITIENDDKKYVFKKTDTR